jgi:mannose-6-phosphate isomerase-like protein (cupin superfamily)
MARITDDVGSERRYSGNAVISLAAVAQKLPGFWSPRVVAEVDDFYVKVAKVKGELAWHHHEGEDELFLVLKGTLRIEMEDRAVRLEAGELFVVPKRVRHNPVADEECHILLFERKSTAHTGDVVTDRTRSIREQLEGP